MRTLTVLALVAALSLAAAPAKKKAAAPSVAPDTLAHPMALFLGALSKDGARQVTFKARALGVRFFLEEPSGVTVYRFEKGQYVKEEVLEGLTLDRAAKRYAKK